MIDENTTNILKALAPQQGRAGVDQIVMQLLSSALQPQPTPEDQLRELFAQSKINTGDFQGALDALNAKPGELESLFSQTGSVTQGEQSIIDAELEALIADTNDVSKKLKLSRLADNPVKTKEFLEFKPESNIRDRFASQTKDMSLGEAALRGLSAPIIGPTAYTVGDGLDLTDLLFGGKTKDKQRYNFLDQLLK